ncbi:hypothetical protein [Micrococcoides hystricis]|uniref:Uncharacterized protein n=1 Tax=Micrococcoides hystricis TaxID=1572761 RepID=A0ABV6P8U5_9MICC
MAETLYFPDSDTLTDLKTLVQRARAINDDGIRLQAAGKVLALWVGLMNGALGSGVPTMIGMRAVPLAQESTTDVVVNLQSLTDRFARLDTDATELSVPPTTIDAAWAGISAPRSGWQVETESTVQVLRQVAASVAETMATTLPETPGQAVVNSLRNRVWAEDFQLGPVTIAQGAAFAAEALGFLSGPVEAPVKVLRNGPWQRISCPHGQVLIKA